jgi:hypothetical protein
VPSLGGRQLLALRHATQHFGAGENLHHIGGAEYSTARWVGDEHDIGGQCCDHPRSQPQRPAARITPQQHRQKQSVWRPKRSDVPGVLSESDAERRAHEISDGERPQSEH